MRKTACRKEQFSRNSSKILHPRASRGKKNNSVQNFFISRLTDQPFQRVNVKKLLKKTKKLT